VGRVGKESFYTSAVAVGDDNNVGYRGDNPKKVPKSSLAPWLRCDDHDIWIKSTNDIINVLLTVVGQTSTLHLVPTYPLCVVPFVTRPTVYRVPPI
jgi:hypothetical protein